MKRENHNLSEQQALELFTDSNKVLEYVAELKWEKGFVCRKCGNTNYCEGKTPFSRRCTRCKTEESASAHTIFHNIKFPINKAFFILYHICSLRTKCTSEKLSNTLNINQMTCWKFKSRILKCIKEEKTVKKRMNLSIVILTENLNKIK